jgi:dTDP-glucose pyrophosphorylase
VEQAMDKAVILARGLGKRMRRASGEAELTDAEAAAADTGVKALIPIGRPFVDYTMSALADAGYRSVCLVIGPEHRQIREHCAGGRLKRLEVSFAVQAEPLGTADAVAAAETFAGDDDVLVINSDNYYPPSALGGLRQRLGGSGLAAFQREGLLAGGTIPPERIAAYAIVQADADGRLARIIEKPTDEDIARIGHPVFVSMNCWRFSPVIFEACRSIELSPRGELELPFAVEYARDVLGETFEVLRLNEPVLDLSTRADIAGVKAHLADVEVNL